MNHQGLIQFLIASNQAGYAGGDNKNWTKEPDGSTSIIFNDGKWKFHDNYFGGEPYGGREVVFFEDKPYWIMVYYGWVEKTAESNPVYAILREALKQMPPDAPFRGPRLFESESYKYENKWQGSVDRFSGEEQITHDGILVYKANYIGGLVDQRSGV